MSKKHIEDSVEQSLQTYFKDLNGTAPAGIYDMMLQAVEKPMLVFVMHQADGNQSKAAEWLGLNRNTLRKKLIENGLA